MKELNVKIVIQDENTCGEGCPFLAYSTCRLFNEELEETELPTGYVWQDDQLPTRVRYYCCRLFD